MAEPIEPSTEPLQEPVASYDTAISCLARLSMPSGGAARIEAAHRSADPGAETLPLSRLVRLAAEFGLQAEWVQLDWHGLKIAVVSHPLLIVRENADVLVVTGGGRSGAEEVSVWDPHHDGVVFFVSREDFERTWSCHALIITPEDEGANIVKLPTDCEPAPVTTGDTAPIPSNIPERQKAPRTSWRSLGLPLGLAATAIVASADVALFLLTPPTADRVVGPSIPTRVDAAEAQNTLANPREATPTGGVVAIAPVVPTSEAAPTSRTPTSTGPAANPAPDGAPLLGAPTQEASPALPPTEAPSSTIAASAERMPQVPLSIATPIPGEPSAGPAPSGPEMATLLAHGDALLRKGDLAAARLFYERAADAGDGQAAIRLGETFDPVFLDHAQLRGARGDMDKALVWYRRARDLGATEAEVLLEGLEAK